jgi:hypothetical protein
MVDIVLFPEKYVLVNRFVDRISCVAESDELLGSLGLTDGNIDFYVYLRTGLSYAFVAATPENARFEMDSQDIRAFVVVGMIIVAAADADSIMEAIEQCLEITQNDEYPLGRFGCLQING